MQTNEGTFKIRQYKLPHEGIIPGAPGHKKQVIPKGTLVYCIVYGAQVYWCAYLKKEQALKCAAGLEKTLIPGTRRYIDIHLMLQWNFSLVLPKRVCRP